MANSDIKQFDPDASYLVGGAILNELIRVCAGLRPFLDIKTETLQIDKGTNAVKIDVKKTAGGVDIAKTGTITLEVCDGSGTRNVTFVVVAS